MSRTSVPDDGLRPLYGLAPRVLVLGSYPSVLSLARSEYYGNPRNHFWAVMEAVFGIPAALPYTERSLRLQKEGVACWDVVGSCSRAGSADSTIRNPVPNDIRGFVRGHPSVRLIALNGGTAGRLFHRFAEGAGIPSVTLPSTSPANAAMTFAEKVRRWQVVRDACTRD